MDPFLSTEINHEYDIDKWFHPTETVAYNNSSIPNFQGGLSEWSLNLGHGWVIMSDYEWCGVALGCYGYSIIPGAAIVTSQCYGRYCSTEYMRTWAGHLSTPWLREFTAITGCQHDALIDQTCHVGYRHHGTYKIYF